ncbi:hypothetical protein MB02_01670 [Croceicoccus estronivorus]|nr:hypothetical protein MB02_01670 [Croceicoccus estronivorus]
MEAWRPDIAGLRGPKYRAIADALADAVERGTLRDGDRLPPQRELALQLGIDLTTVTRAYELARQRGLIEARGRAGSFIRTNQTQTAPLPAQFDVTMNSPPARLAGLLQDAIAKGYENLARSGAHSRLQYQRPGGDLADRSAGATILSRVGLSANIEQVVVTAGGQNALHGIAATILRPGDRVACGRFIYPGFRAIARQLGITLIPLPEITATTLANAHRDAPLRALYVVPSNDNPTATTLDSKQREAIAAFADRADIRIIEDDAYGLLAASPLPAIASFAPSRSWYIASTSKIISPALRVGFVRTPDIADALHLTARLHETGVMAPPLNAAMVSAWIADGTFDRLVTATREEASWRQQQAGRFLKTADYSAHPQGYHLWLRLPDETRLHDLAEALGQVGLSVIPSDRFAVEPDDNEKALRISLGGTIDREALLQALGVLQGYVATSASPAELII